MAARNAIARDECNRRAGSERLRSVLILLVTAHILLVDGIVYTS